MSDRFPNNEKNASTITEALERATRLHAEVLAQIEELLGDDGLVPVPAPTHAELLRRRLRATFDDVGAWSRAAK